MRRVVMVAGLLVMMASEALAAGGLGLHLNLGFAGEGEADEISSDQGSIQLDDEDLEGMYGAGVWLDYEVIPSLYVGGRLNFNTAEGEDTEVSSNTIDIAPFVRYVLEFG